MEKTRGKIKNRLFIIGGALLCFAFIAYLVTSRDVLGFDTIIREWFYGLRGPVQNALLIFITYLGNWQSVVVVCLMLLGTNGTRIKYGVPTAITAVCSTVTYKLVKMAFARPRPDLAVRIIEQGGFSFPSGHSMNSLVVYGLLIYLVGRYCKDEKKAKVLTTFLTVLIALIGLSRIYVGVHYPTDVLGGWSLGLAVLMIAIIIIEKIKGESNTPDRSENSTEK
ncbi:MAG TPA: phosphatase PAP2 family protein [Anaerovoracaceae bacterium]|nr:phosphatase PAP2 family protein [Anaerovoracaceae bacterium]